MYARSYQFISVFKFREIIILRYISNEFGSKKEAICPFFFIF